jgi:succinate dehydrogenase assembly factor 1
MAFGITLTERREEFRKNLRINKKDFGTIEYLLRSGRRKLETYHDPEIRDIHRA